MIFLAVFTLVTWVNYSFLKSYLVGGDFVKHWAGTRLLLAEGISPYSDEAAARIQSMVYGRAARSGEDALRSTYPLYSIVFFLPFAIVPDLLLAQSIWMTAMILALVGLARISTRLAGWKPDILLSIAYYFFVIFWFHSFAPLVTGSTVILVALFIVGGLYALRLGGDEMAGVLFAFATIQLRPVMLLLAFIFYWIYLKRRWRILIWFLSTLALLTASSSLLIPDWPVQNLREIIQNWEIGIPATPAEVLSVIWLPEIGRRVGQVISGVVALLLLVEWAFARKATSRGFLWAASLTMACSQWLGLPASPVNYIVMLPALVQVFVFWEERWQRGGRMFSLALMLVLFLWLWLPNLNALREGVQAAHIVAAFFPLPAVVLIGLYWMRWWIFRPYAASMRGLYGQDDLEEL